MFPTVAVNMLCMVVVMVVVIVCVVIAGDGGTNGCFGATGACRWMVIVAAGGDDMVCTAGAGVGMPWVFRCD